MSRFPGGCVIYASMLLKRHSVVNMSQNKAAFVVN